MEERRTTPSLAARITTRPRRHTRCTPCVCGFGEPMLDVANQLVAVHRCGEGAPDLEVPGRALEPERDVPDRRSGTGRGLHSIAFGLDGESFPRDHLEPPVRDHVDAP